MRIKTLFSIPDGEKVTDKALRKVLISSICSILLCMTCLVSTTWAWFTVSIVNTGNEIIIAELEPTVTIKLENGDPIAPSNEVYALEAGKYLIEAEIQNNASESDAFGSKEKPVYLVMTVSKPDTSTENYFFDASEKIEQKLTIGNTLVKISFYASWVQPNELVDSEELLIGEPLIQQVETSTAEPTTEPTTEVTTESTTESTTEATTEVTTEPTTEPTTETTTE